MERKPLSVCCEHVITSKVIKPGKGLAHVGDSLPASNGRNSVLFARLMFFE